MYFSLSVKIPDAFIFFSFLKIYLLLKCSHRTSESFCKMQIFGQPRVRGWRMYSEALNKDSHEYDKGDTHKQNRPPEKKGLIKIMDSKIGSSQRHLLELSWLIFFLEINLFCLSRQTAEIFSISLIKDFLKPHKISAQ